MSTRSRKRKNNYQEEIEIVGESLVSPVLVENVDLGKQDVMIVGPSSAKTPRDESSVSESLRATLKEEITSEIKGLLIETQRKRVVETLET